MTHPIHELAGTFHTLQSYPPIRDGGFIEDFDSEHFAHWAGAHCSSGGRDAALFVLSVWNSSTDWKEYGITNRGDGTFDLHAALDNWDRQQRAAFIVWAQEPWWS